ncbi:MAG: hypothetical protein QXS20_07840 [Candidatus Thorarchaeota archaeon]
MTPAKSTAYVAVFAATIAALDSVPIIPVLYSGVWDSWLFLLSPLVGVLLGPHGGAVAVGIGTLVGHLVYFRDPSELVFMVGAPVGAAVSGLVYLERWRPALMLYSALLLTYSVTPVSWALPLWGVWDVLLGYGLLLILSVRSRLRWRLREEHGATNLGLLFSTVIGLESDTLTRISILISCGTYQIFYGLGTEDLRLIWMAAALVSPLNLLMAVAVVVTLGRTLIRHVGYTLSPSAGMDDSSEPQQGCS